jgi:amino acid adenylation domain-containing protein
VNVKNYSPQHEVAANRNVKEREYWLNKLSGELVKHHIPYDMKPGTGQSHPAGFVTFKVPGDLFTSLTEVAKGSDHGLHVILAAGLAVLLRRCAYDDSNDIVTGVPVYKTGNDKVYINTVLTLRTGINWNMTFKEIIMQVRRDIIQSTGHQNYPIEILVDQLNLPVAGDNFPLFDIAVLLENIHDKDYIRRVEPNIVFSFLKTGEGIEGTVEYNPALYYRQTVERVTGHYMFILSSCLADVNERIGDIDMLPGDEKQQLLYRFNDTDAGYSANKTIHQLFEARCAESPDSIAVVDDDAAVTYRELDGKANRLARLLRARGVRRGGIVALMMDNSPGMLIAVLAVLKLGAAYLPVEPENPVNRVISMLDDCRVSVILTQGRVLKRHSFTSLQGLERAKTQTVRTKTRPQIGDLDNLPLPDRSSVDYEKYHRFIGLTMFKNSISLQATRGCPYKCAYCHKIWPKTHIIRSAENIFAEVRLYYDMGVRKFAFVDDIFNLNKKNSGRFFQMVLEHNMDVQFFFPAGLRGDILTSDYIDLMVEAGTVNVGLALETASPRLQKLIGKNLNLEKLRENIEYFCAKHPHVITELFIMHGFPTETEEEAMMTMDFVKNLKWVHFPYFHILKIYPNTDMAKLAIDNGVSSSAITGSINLAYHELPLTLPFDKNFSLKCQTDFFSNYFLSRQRLLDILPYQMKLLTEDEMVQKYDSYLTAPIKRFPDLLEFTGINEDELGAVTFADEERHVVPGINEKMANAFPTAAPGEKALKILLLDLSQFFSHREDMLYDVVEPPLGLMYILSYLKKEFGSKVNVRIAKSRIDFDNFARLKALLDEFKPDVIGLRTLSFYRDFLHETAAMIRLWGVEAPVIAGGPYATSDYESILADKNIDLVVMGEGEATFAQLIEKIMNEGGTLPAGNELEKIPGIAFTTGNSAPGNQPGRDIIFMDHLDDILPGHSPGNLEYGGDHPQPIDPAYIIYTSGTTGRPKGVMIENRNVVRLMVTDDYLFDFGRGDTWTMFHSYAFDFSVWEIWGALLYGGRLALVAKTVARDPWKFLKLLKERCVTVLNQTPSAFYNLAVEEAKQPGKELRLRYVIFGGEALHPGKLNEWRAMYPGARLINMFGITETTVHVTYKEIGDREISLNQSNIGRPIPTLQVYILDSNLRLSSIGIPGELCVGGAGLGRGYLNRPELTGEKFIENPYLPGQTLYRSGDLARWLDNGELEYLGRIDRQVKIRGFRIELGEIESHLLKRPDIRETVVVTRPDSTGKNDLCAYVVPDNPEAFDSGESISTELKKYLAGFMPAYMIPAHFVPLAAIPLNANGKIDSSEKKKKKKNAGDDYVAPRSEIEKKLAEMWAGVLNIDKQVIGIHANFFELGGHSLRTIELLARIHETFDVKVEVLDVFNIATLGGLAKHIAGAKKDTHLALQPAEQKEYYVLSSAQVRMYFVWQMDPGNINYNMPQIVFLNGDIDNEKLTDTFRRLIHRHENLRTSFEMIDGEPVQRVHPRLEFNMERQAFADQASLQAAINGCVRPFDLARAPLLRVNALTLGNETGVLVVDMHHIITDAISNPILVNDFLALHRGEELAPLKLQYKDYAEWQRNLPDRLNRSISRREEYWLSVFEPGKGRIPVLHMPTDFPRPPVRRFEGSRCYARIDAPLTGKIQRLASDTGATFYMVLLAAFTILLSRYGRQEDIIVGSPLSGRKHADLQNIIGMFVNMLPMRNYPAGHKTFAQFLEEVKINALSAFENQDYQLEELVTRLGLQRDRGRHPLFDVVFELTNIDADAAGQADDAADNIYEYVTSKYDLILGCRKFNNCIKLHIEYAAALFKPVTIDRMLTRFIDILGQVTEDRDIQLKDVTIAHELLTVKSFVSSEDAHEDFDF